MPRDLANGNRLTRVQYGQTETYAYDDGDKLTQRSGGPQGTVTYGYDAWGVVRSQQSGGDPKLRYCGSLGHRQDDESGLVYMRARYYEPSSGRFISEDSTRDGNNDGVLSGGAVSVTLEAKVRPTSPCRQSQRQ